MSGWLARIANASRPTPPTHLPVGSALSSCTEVARLPLPLSEATRLR